MARYLVLKDGHQGSLWFAQTVTSFKGSSMIFEAGPCLSRFDFLFNCDRGHDTLPCECTRRECATRTCDNRSFTKTCNVFGVSVIAPPPLTVAKWAHLGGNCAVRPKIVVHIRTNLAKMAYSFYRSMPAKGFTRNETALTTKEQIHVYNRLYTFNNTPEARIVHVDPRKYLNIMKAKQIRQFRICQSALSLARNMGAKHSSKDAMYRLVYEKLQVDMYKEVIELFLWMGVPPPRKKEEPPENHVVVKASPEDLTRVIANFKDLDRMMSPCGKKMLNAKLPVAFNGCRTTNCCWLSKI